MATAARIPQQSAGGPTRGFIGWLFQPDLEGELRLIRWLIIAVILGGAIFMVLPLYWMLRSSVIDPRNYYHLPLYWVPPRIYLENFRLVFEKTNFGRGYLNTLIYAGLTVANLMIVNVPAAYAFARLRFRGRDVLFMVYLATMMIPGDATAIPRFVILRRIGFYNNWGGLILPFNANPFNIFLLRQFFLSIPRELEEAAFIEGCSEFKAMWYIMLPLAKPILAVIALWAVQGAWGDFFWPLIITRSETMRTAAVAVTFMGAYAIQREPGALMAAVLMLNLPIVIIALFAQKAIVQGFARSLVIG